MLTDEERAITGGLSMDDYIWRENMKHERLSKLEEKYKHTEQFKKKRDELRERMRKYMEQEDMGILSMLEEILDARDNHGLIEIKVTPWEAQDIPF